MKASFRFSASDFVPFIDDDDDDDLTVSVRLPPQIPDGGGGRHRREEENGWYQVQSEICLVCMCRFTPSQWREKCPDPYHQ